MRLFLSVLYFSSLFDSYALLYTVNLCPASSIPLHIHFCRAARILLLGVVFQSCEIIPGESRPELEQTLQEQRTEVQACLEALALKVEDKDKDKIVGLAEEIKWQSLSYPSTRKGNFLAIYSLIETGSFPIRKALFYMSQQEFAYAQLVEFAPDEPFDIDIMVANLFQETEHNYSGIMSISNLLGQKIVENRFSKGGIFSNTRLTSVGQGLKEPGSRTQQFF